MLFRSYTGFWLNTPRKKVHGGPSKTYSKWSAVAIEQEGYIDAINTPEWGVDQICMSLRLRYTMGFAADCVLVQTILGRTTSGRRRTSSPPFREMGGLVRAATWLYTR